MMAHMGDMSEGSLYRANYEIALRAVQTPPSRVTEGKPLERTWELPKGAHPMQLRYDSGPRVRQLRKTEIGGDGVLVGMALPWDKPTLVGPDRWESAQRGCTTKTIAEHGTGIRLYSTHDTYSTQPIGLPQRAEDGSSAWDDREDGLYVTMALNGTHGAEDAKKLVRTGSADGFSVGFFIVKTGTDIRTRDAEGKEMVVTVLQEIILHHLALVADPAYPDAGVTEMRSQPDPEALAATQALLDEYGVEVEDD